MATGGGLAPPLEPLSHGRGAHTELCKHNADNV